MTEILKVGSIIETRGNRYTIVEVTYDKNVTHQDFDNRDGPFYKRDKVNPETGDYWFAHISNFAKDSKIVEEIYTSYPIFN